MRKASECEFLAFCVQTSENQADLPQHEVSQHVQDLFRASVQVQKASECEFLAFAYKLKKTKSISQNMKFPSMSRIFSVFQLKCEKLVNVSS